MKNISYKLLAISSVLLASCSSDKLDPQTVFVDSQTKPTPLDAWVYKNYVQDYNVEFKYRFEDKESALSYNLTPAAYKQSVHMARLTKFLWYEAYDEVTGSKDFMRKNSPRILFLVGSAAYNPRQGSEVLGTAEGGLKITLYKVNEIDQMGEEMRNRYFFRTMHHEFGHILHQTINYPKEFEMISLNDYTSEDWINKKDDEMYKKGFVSAYGSSQPREDFVEFIAHYVTHTAEYWENLRTKAGDTGAPIIDVKLQLIKTYLRDRWSLNLDKLREVVLRRTKEAASLNLDDISLTRSEQTLLSSLPHLKADLNNEPSNTPHEAYEGYSCYASTFKHSH